MFDLLCVPFVYVFEVIFIPDGKKIGEVVPPAVDEVNRADNIVELIRCNDLFYAGLIFEVADLDPCFNRIVFFFEHLHEREVIIERIAEFAFLKPFLLIGADDGIIEDQFVVIEVFEFGETVAVLGDPDAVDTARFGTVEEALYPIKVVRAIFKMHMIVKFHGKIPFVADNIFIIRQKRKFGYWYRTKRNFFKKIKKLCFLRGYFEKI